jgi:hypothetical protein
MTLAWAQRQAELLRDCIVSPDVFAQTASEHCLPQCGIKPIVSDSRKC